MSGKHEKARRACGRHKFSATLKKHTIHYAGITQISLTVSGIRPLSQPDFIKHPCSYSFGYTLYDKCIFRKAFFCSFVLIGQADLQRLAELIHKRYESPADSAKNPNRVILILHTSPPAQIVELRNREEAAW